MLYAASRMDDDAPPLREGVDMKQSRADIARNRGQTTWEPCKAMATATLTMLSGPLPPNH
jgi:hypothetical protein